MILTAGTPANPRAGVLAVIEGGRHMLTVAGICGDHPPTDPPGFDDFVGRAAIRRHRRGHRRRRAAG